jgi:anti-anti-sigma factor
MLNKPTEARLRRTDNAAIIDVSGDVTEQGEQAIKGAYVEALAGDPRRVFLNFGDTEYINTSGIAVLISLVMEAEKAGRKVGLYGMSAHYKKVFTLVRLPLYADMFESEGEALASL